MAMYEHMAFFVHRPPANLTAENSSETATKLHCITRAVVADRPRRKTCIIMHFESGYAILQKLLRDQGVKFGWACYGMTADKVHRRPHTWRWIGS